MRRVTDGSCVGQFRSDHCERGSADARDCNRLVEARSGSGLEPTRAPHVATIANDHRASERQGASDVQTPSPMLVDDRLHSSIAARSHTSAAGLDFAKLPTTTGRSATRGTCWRATIQTRTQRQLRIQSTATALAPLQATRDRR